MAMITARAVTILEMVPAMARPPVEKMAPRSGVRSVTPQVGQPAPRAMRPVMRPALPRFSALLVCSVFAGLFGFLGMDVVLLDLDLTGGFLCQRRTMIPMRMPCKIEMVKIGSQSRKGSPTPKIAMKLSQMICRPPGKPRMPIISNLAVPPERRFINNPKNRKLGTKPYQKCFSLVASKMPLPANTNSSHHFLQFI